MYGYVGKLLFVNLSDGSTEIRDLKEEDARNFIGGYGLGAKILYDEMPANTDPFSEASMMGILSGPFNGAGVIFGGRYMVVCKSPVTGGWNDANSGGFFAPALKGAGFDAIFVKGIASKPSYIFIDEGKVEIRDAGVLWGKTVEETEKALAGLHEGLIRSILIGPAGENLSLMAAVMNDGHRAAGRGGPGAVMGSKKLKAIVVKGRRELPVFDKEKVKENNTFYLNILRGPAAGFFNMFGTGGTGSGFVPSTQSGDGGVKNWSGAGVVDYPADKAAPVSSQGIDSTKVKKYACANCPMGCGAFHDMPSERWDLKNSPRPEYETMGAFGSMMLNSDVESVFRCNNLCNEYGFDTISAGNTIAWAMECFEEGVLSEAELDGIKLKWGDGDAIAAIMEKMCKAEGVGKILMMGSRAAADHFGKGQEFLVTAQGIEEPMHDSRLAYGLARTYQYDPTPGRHVKGGIGMGIQHTAGHSIDYRGTGFADMTGVVGVEQMNAAGLCMFGSMILGPFVKMQFEAVTGFRYSDPEWIALGQRIFT
ncbi:MAG: aldehyde ferredoxin oxidoreductase family protein, partial [Clostridiales bacterium]|nr:aldehyde ferredoxin oxidoreductase family protein [Clostridiales bacterium]